MGRLFGTDGIRGTAGLDVTVELAMAVAGSATGVLLPAAGSEHRPVVAIGRDTRPSGEALEAAMSAGFAACGVDVVVLGVVPTPLVARVSATSADLGVMISASHNQMADNGIKFFAAGGHKLTDDVEDAIEAGLQAAPARVTGDRIGRVLAAPGWLVEGYSAHLLAALPHRLDGLTVVVDCAQGSASRLAPQVYRAAGARVVAIHADADGYHINDGCGATHLESLQAAVLEHAADVGIAHDGDADRCLAVDATGTVVDGDAILAILAVTMQEAGALAGGAVAATVMANLGFRQAMTEHGVRVVETGVGDRYVLEAMRRDGLCLGGEQSGHLVLLDQSTTGDGLLTALMLLARVAATGHSLADLAAVMMRLPQVLVNVPVLDRAVAMASPSLAQACAAASSALGSDGRVLVRQSGTESLVRVMVEAPTVELAQDHADRVAASLA